MDTKTTKLSILLKQMAAALWADALKLAASFQQLGEHKAAITRAADALKHPDFYRQLGKDPDALVQLGIAALRARYITKGTPMKKQEVVDKRTAERVSHAPAGKDHDKIADILAMKDADKRAAELYDAGYCDSNYGTCHADNGKIAKRKETSSFCEHHAPIKRAAKAVTTMAAPKSAPLKDKLRKAAGPKEPKQRASHDVGAVTAYMKEHPGTPYSKAKAAVAAAAKK